ncbi:hypothetical protein BH20ACT2_BH20ACT2_05330 [soil metagenome]
MATRSAPEDLVGRDRLLTRLAGLVDRAAGGERQTVLISGEAGIGKTALLRAAAADADARGARVGWGTCIDIDGAPGYWPWTQLLNGMVRAVRVSRARKLAGDDTALLATIAPAFGDSSPGEESDRTRLLLWDATARWLDALGEEAPVVVVLDDLQWADESSLALLDFVSRAPQRAQVCVIGAYRHDELSPATRQRIDAIVGRAEHLPVAGLDAAAVTALVERVGGGRVDRERAETIHQRSGGHPLFVRELAMLPHRPDSVDDIPSAVREAIERRTARLPRSTLTVLEAIALIGVELLTDVVAGALDLSTVDVERSARAAIDAGILAPGRDRPRFAHDLVREATLARIDLAQRVQLHSRIGAALEDRMARAGDVAPAELARHFTNAVARDGPERACRWSLEAAAADRAILAFAEAAGHLRRLRSAVADAGVALDDRRMTDVLVAEADALARAGSTVDARGLLRMACDVADRSADAARIAHVALATSRLGARFAARRDEIVDDLERALTLIGGADPELEALVAATLARELQHSVVDDRPRAGPLSERALDLGRRAGSPTTLAICLLARHDVLWTPGRGAERAEVAREIVAVAQRSGDDEHEAEGQLLLANALLEQGSGAFAAPLESCLAILDRLGQPRHHYTAETRRACIALLRGDLGAAAERIESAARLGERIREPDTGNVRMSQRLELVRAGGVPDALREFATDAIAHWTGAPVHANAVAAGFCARAGDTDAARRHLAVVADLGGWQADRSYLWSVYVRELAHAAVAVADRGLCAQLLHDLQPLATSCGVNGAVVAFAGSHAHTAGLLAAALDQADIARSLLAQGRAIYQRLGAPLWEAETELGLDSAGSTAPPSAPPVGSMRRDGAVWHLAFSGSQATVPHVKGLTDLAVLLAAEGREVHVLDLVGSAVRSPAGGDLVDEQSLDAYRRRLADIDDDITEAERHDDDERAARLSAERQALLDELGRVTGIGHRPRQFASHPAERARKAVTARIRDAIKKIDPVLPALAAHLERSIVTGTYCRYRPDDAFTWDIRDTSRGATA